MAGIPQEIIMIPITEQKCKCGPTFFYELLSYLGINKACGLISGLELVDYCKTCKAFDMAGHQPWLQKLKVYGKDNYRHKRYQSYISGRKQMVL